MLNSTYCTLYKGFFIKTAHSVLLFLLTYTLLHLWYHPCNLRHLLMETFSIYIQLYGLQLSSVLYLECNLINISLPFSLSDTKKWNKKCPYIHKTVHQTPQVKKSLWASVSSTCPVTLSIFNPFQILIMRFILYAFWTDINFKNSLRINNKRLQKI